MPQSSGATVLITGASRGIGAATARAFAAQGFRVALMARDSAALDSLSAETGGLALQCDVADGAAIARAVTRAEEAFGGIDILVNNAAVIGPMAPLAAVDADAWVDSLQINLAGAFRVLRATLPGMLARGGGTVISLSSGAAHRPQPGWSAYCSGKAGLAMLMQALHLDHGAEGIRAIGLSPGTVGTDMQRAIKASGLGPVAALDWSEHIPPSWVAQAIVWLCGPGGADLAGTEVSLRDPALRARIGLASGG